MIRLLALLLTLALPASAQDFSGLARIDMAQSQVYDDGPELVIELALSQTVPYRAFTLDDPRRLVLDFREVDWQGVTRAALLNSDVVPNLRFGTLSPGWSRMVIDLSDPMLIETAGLATDAEDGSAQLTVRLNPTDATTYAARSGPPPSATWDDQVQTPSLPAPAPDDGLLTVMIDPGHGGIDPGAVRGGVIEADLMLQLAIETADALNRTGQVRALLTREQDVFVPLEDRMTIARAAKADLFISLHADALEEDEAAGASVYTLDPEGTDRAAQRMAERHERGDLLAGVDLTGQDDRVATVLMDMARAETAPAGDRFADALVAALRETGARTNSRPRREGRLAVLNAADFPSVLVEAGFLSNADDRAALASPDGRARIVAALVQAIQNWAADEAARKPLIRQ